MKSSFIVFAALMLLLVSGAFAQQDPLDEGAADSIILVATNQPDVVGGDSSVVVECYFYNDVQDVASATALFSWAPAGLVMDSAEATALATSSFNFQIFLYRSGDLDSTNLYQDFQMSGFRLSGNGVPASVSRQHMATYWLSVQSIDPVNDTIWFIRDDWGPASSGNMKFVSATGTNYLPLFQGDVYTLDISDVTVINNGELPKDYALNQNYPNPFNPETTIEFDVPVAGHVKLEVFNVLGQKVKTLVDKDLTPGTQQTNWDGTADGGHHVASGIYFYKMTAGNTVMTKKMMLLK